MSPANLAMHLAAELARGDESLKAAQALVRLRLNPDAASRAYYAVFHYARALVLAVGEEPRSHGGVAHLLSLHFVKTGILPANTSRLFSGLQNFREAADYDAAFVATAKDVSTALAEARTFIRNATRWLRKQRLLPAPSVPASRRRRARPAK